MKITNHLRKILLAVACTFVLLANAVESEDGFRSWAMTPPMGWNSWDCYYSSVTEKEVMQNAQYLVDNDLVLLTMTLCDTDGNMSWWTSVGTVTIPLWVAATTTSEATKTTYSMSTVAICPHPHVSPHVCRKEKT